MSEPHLPQDDRRQPHAGDGPSRQEAPPQAKEMIETVRQSRRNLCRLLKAAGSSDGHPTARHAYDIPSATCHRSPSAPGKSLVFWSAVDILLIDDSAADVALFHHALKQRGLRCEVKFLRQGREVEAFVRQAASAPPHFSPRLIIAECWVPGMDGGEILAALRTVPAYQRIPVVFFSSLAEAEGQRRSAQCGATAFVHKPVKLEAFVEAVATMVRRWGGVHDGTVL